MVVGVCREAGRRGPCWPRNKICFPSVRPIYQAEKEKEKIGKAKVTGEQIPLGGTTRARSFKDKRKFAISYSTARSFRKEKKKESLINLVYTNLGRSTEVSLTPHLFMVEVGIRVRCNACVLYVY
jgi:hypothetical protein